MPPPTRITVRRTASVLALSFIASACATTKHQEIVFPPPPDKARIQYVRSIVTQDDVDKSIWHKISMALLPRDSANAILAPTSLALSPDETTLYAALPNRGRVVAFNVKSGDFRGIGVGGRSPLTRPVGVAVDASGVIYVTDRPANVVVAYSPSGDILRKFGREELVEPTGIAVDRRNQRVYVVNDGSRNEGRHAIEVYSLAGKHLATIGGGASNEPGRFFFPRSVSVSRRGEVYVADMLNFRVQVFDPRGGLLRMFGQAGADFPGQFDKIHAVAIDTFDNVYVADVVQGVHILGSDATPLMIFGPPVARAPSAIVIDSKNTIYVGDLVAGVHEFKLVNTTREDSKRKPQGASGASSAPAVIPTPPAPAAVPTPPAPPSAKK